MNAFSPHTRGVLITGLGVLVVSPDGLLARLVEADQWTIIFWRAYFLCIGMATVSVVLFQHNVFAHWRAVGRAGLYMAVTHVIGMIAFITALTTTSVANTLVILATTPLFAALISWVTMRESLPLRTWITIAVVAAGIVVLSSGSDDGNASLFGDMAALLGAFTLGLSFSITRRYRDRSMLPALSMGAGLAAVVIFPFASPLSASPSDMVYLFLMGMVILPIGMAMMYVGPRYVPAAEVGLMMLLESVVGPFWVWWALGENPGERTFIGGAVILSALSINLLVTRKTQPQVSAP